jgi:hypothetical protein
MRHATVTAVLALGLVIWPAAVGDPASSPEAECQWWTGHVVVQADDASQTMVVTLDSETDGEGTDGIVDQAFRIQALSVLLTFEGRALVAYAKGTLTILPRDDDTPGFEFAVTPRAARSEWAVPVYEAVGVARFWGGAIRQSVAEVQSRLLTSGCTTLAGMESLAGCLSCQDGGPGQAECGVDDDEKPCEVSCMSGSYACCNYPNDCRCCPDIER